MKLQGYLAICCGVLVFAVLAMATHMSASGLNGDNKNSSKYVCSETNPGSMCNASTTCGSTTSACTVDVKRSGGNSASATASIPNAKGNASFCVKVGTTVTWQSGSKNTGFVLDFGPSSPFDVPDGTIIGGAGSSDFRRRQAAGMLQVFRWSLRVRNDLRNVRQFERGTRRNPLGELG